MHHHQTRRTAWAGMALALAGLLSLGPASARQTAPSSDLDAPAASASIFPDDPIRQLRLRDGRIVWGWIEEHTDQELAILRLDTGGRATLPWGLLDPVQEQELKALLGYLDLTSQEPMVSAMRLRTALGDEYLGIILSESPADVEFKTRNGIMRIPRTLLAGPPVQEQVPAREVYTRPELYGKELERYVGAMLDPATPPAMAAQMHWDMGRYSESIRDYGHADYHYRAVVQMDPTWSHPDLEASLARAARLADAQEQADELDEIDRLRLRDRFPEALTRLDNFPLIYPDTPLSTEVAKLRASVLRDRERDMQREVEQRWHHWVGRLAREQARSDDYESTLLWVQEAMSTEVVARVIEDLTRYQDDLDEARVRELFLQRDTRRNRRATYGVGTWLIGRDAAVKEIVADDAPVPEVESPASERTREREELEERIQRYLQSQQLSAVGGGGGFQEQADPQEFWESWTALSRTQWIIAYYAENLGDMRTMRASLQPCRECGGVGALEESAASANGGTRLLQCWQCKGVPVRRRVSYR
ncbi:MAG: hypothetical protein AAFZ65_10580 [Planctomycetota bacterium]